MGTITFDGDNLEELDIVKEKDETKEIKDKAEKIEDEINLTVCYNLDHDVSEWRTTIDDKDITSLRDAKVEISDEIDFLDDESLSINNAEEARKVEEEIYDLWEKVNFMEDCSLTKPFLEKLKEEVEKIAIKVNFLLTVYPLVKI